MRQAIIRVDGYRAGLLTESDDGVYTFQYDKEYLECPTCASVSMTLPKREEVFISDSLFPFFFSLLSEGANKQVQCMRHRIDVDDYFGLLLATANFDTIGNVTVEET